MCLILPEALLVALTLAIALTLCTDVVAKHGTKNEIFFRCKFVKRTSNKETNGLQAFSAAKIYIQIFLTGWLQHVRYALTLQS